MRNQKLKYFLFILFLGACIMALGEGTVQAKNYTSKKQVKAEIKKTKKQAKKAKATYQRAKKKYKELSKKSSNYLKGTKSLFLAKIVSTNPMVVYQGGSYYRVANPSAGVNFLGSYTASIRVTGGYSNINGYTCANVKAVSSPYSKAKNAQNRLYQKNLKRYKNLKKKITTLTRCLKFRIGPGNMVVYMGEPENIKPSKTYYNKIRVKSSNPSVVKVVNKTVLKPVKPGSAVVTTKASISGKKTKFRVDVRNKGSMRLNYSSYILGTKGKKSVKSVTLKNMEGIRQNKLSWSSSNAGVAKVNGSGKVTAVGCGTATIKAESGEKIGVCQITVIEPQLKFEASEMNYTDNDFGTQKTIHFTSNIPDLKWYDPKSNFPSTEMIYQMDALDYHPETNPGGLVDGTVTITIKKRGSQELRLWSEDFSEVAGDKYGGSGTESARVNINVSGMTINKDESIVRWWHEASDTSEEKLFCIGNVGEPVSLSGFDTDIVNCGLRKDEDEGVYIDMTAHRPGKTSVTVTTSTGYSHTFPISIYGINFYDEEGNRPGLTDNSSSDSYEYITDVYKAYENPLFDYTEEELTGYIRIEAIVPENAGVTVCSTDEDEEVLALGEYVDGKQYYRILDTGKAGIEVKISPWSSYREILYTCYINISGMTGIPEGADEQDVAALKKIIAAQRKQGAKINSNLSSDEYTWDENGKLVGIKWDGIKVGEDEEIGALYESRLAGSLDVSGCVNLKELSCSHNALTALDVSGCAYLEKLSCSGNALTELDVSGCTNLTALECYENQLSSLDVSRNVRLANLDCGDNGLSALNVGSCPDLTNLQCYGNQLSALDVSGNSKLTNLGCSWNQLTDLDVGGCTDLTTFECDNNQLTVLDVSGNTKLTSLECWMNQLDSLDVSGCVELAILSCGDNRLTELDVSRNTKLTKLICYGNQLAELDVSANKELITLDCSSNRLKKLDVSQNVNLVTLLCTDNGLGVLDLTNNTNLSSLDCDEGVIVTGY